MSRTVAHASVAATYRFPHVDWRDVQPATGHRRDTQPWSRTNPRP